MRVAFSLLVAGALLAACSGPRFGEQGGIQVSANGDLPPPERADLAATSRPYLIGPFDKLSIDVFGIPDLSREAQTDASGRMSLPLAGVIEAAGKTPNELAAIIEDRLRERFVRDPQVTVNLKETVSQVVTVDGEVREPGLYPVVGKMTLMQAVARARGLTDLAQTSNVLVFRTVNGQKLAGLYNLKAIRQGNYADPEIYANDVVVVSDSRARRIFKDLLQASPILSAPLVAILR